MKKLFGTITVLTILTISTILHSNNEGANTMAYDKLHTVNRENFYTAWRIEFKGVPLTKTRKRAINELLEFMEYDPWIEDVHHIAYMLATVYHETGKAMRPTKEKMQTGAKTKAQKALQAKQQSYSPFFGRGLVHLTHEYNYDLLGTTLVSLYPEYDFEVGSFLVNHPDKALEPETAYHIMSVGMRTGLFTGKKLSDFNTKDGYDYKGARTIINGKDRAALIAGYAKKFELILNRSVAHDDEWMIDSTIRSELTAEDKITMSFESVDEDIRYLHSRLLDNINNLSLASKKMVSMNKRIKVLENEEAPKSTTFVDKVIYWITGYLR